MMNTIRLFSFFIVMLLAVTAKAQLTSNPDIQKRLDAFIDLTNQKKYSEAFDLMYPKMFNQVNKQELVDMMTSMNNDGLGVTINNRRITSFSGSDRSIVTVFVVILNFVIALPVHS